MCNPGLRKHHWDAMSEIAGFNLTPDAGTTLRKVLKLGLDEFMEKFEVISVSATKVSSVCFSSHLSWYSRHIHACFAFHSRATEA